MISGSGTLGIGVAIGFAVQGISSVLMAQRQLGSLVSTFKNASAEAKNMAMGLGLIVAGLVAMKAASVGFKFLGNAVDTYADLETQMRQLQSIRQLSDDERDALEQQIIDWSLMYPFAAAEIADAAKTIGRAGFDVETSMAMTEAAMRAAVIGETDVVTATDTMVSAFKVFGFTAEDSIEVVDILAKATTQAWLEMDDFSQAFSRFGPIAMGTNQSMEEMVVLLGTLTDTGLSSTRAGTMLKMMLTKLQAPTSAASQALANLGIQTREVMEDGSVHVRSLVDIMNDLNNSSLPTAEIDAFLMAWTGDEAMATDIAEAQALRSIFGQRALVGAAAFENAQQVVNGVMLRGNDLLQYRLGQLQDVSGFSAEYIATQQESWNNMKTMLENAKQAFLLTVGAAMMPAFKLLLSAITGIVTTIGDFFREHPAMAKILGWVIGGISIAVMAAGLLAIFGGIAMLLSSYVIWEAVLMGIRMLGLMLQIALLLLVIILIVKFWDEIKAGITAAAKWVAKAFIDAVVWAAKGLWSVIKWLANAVFFLAMIPLRLLIAAWTWYLNLLWNIGKAIVNWIVTAFNDVINWIVTAYNDVKTFLADTWDFLKTGLITALASVINWLIDMVNKLNPFKDIEHVTWGQQELVSEVGAEARPEGFAKGSYEFPEDTFIQVHKRERLIKDGDTDYQAQRGMSKGGGVSIGTLNLNVTSSGDERVDAKRLYKQFLEYMRAEGERSI